jgi:hypothetical protein
VRRLVVFEPFHGISLLQGPPVLTEADPLAVSELLTGASIVAWMAERSAISVRIVPTQCERDDVINHLRLGC